MDEAPSSAGPSPAGARGGEEDASPGVSVVIPVYNSRDTIAEVVRQAAAVLEEMAVPFEFLLVNDGSTDGSWDVLRALSSELPTVTAFDLSRNFGQHNALLAGIRRATKDVIVTMDDDLQHPARELKELVAELDKGFDVVYGSPERERHGFRRAVSSWLLRTLLKRITGIPALGRASAFRAFRTSLRDAFSRFEGPYVSVDVLLSWATRRFGHVRVRREERKVGRSNYTFRKLAAVALDLLTGFSTFPLRIATHVGFLFTLLGFAALIFVVGRYVVEGGSVPGFPFLASIISIFAGAQLFALGVFGEYLSRIFLHAMKQPAYHVREVAGSGRAGRTD